MTLRAHPDPLIRQIVAGDERSDITDLLYLTADDDPEVAEQARNTIVTAYTADKGRDPDWDRIRMGFLRFAVRVAEFDPGDISDIPNKWVMDSALGKAKTLITRDGKLPKF